MIVFDLIGVNLFSFLITLFNYNINLIISFI